jgi:XTP/dITP diphosphohydrolase
MELLFASHNKGKTAEIQKLLGHQWQLKNLHDLGVQEEIEETGDTLEENATIKAQFLFDRYGIPCFADDSGLEVESLDKRPGVYSARYAGAQKNDVDNMDLLLSNLQGVSDRSAQFRTVIAYIDNHGTKTLFEGTVKGQIIHEKRGDRGFGYDPVFRPEGHNITFAQMSMAEKNGISHRAIATNALVTFLQK